MNSAVIVAAGRGTRMGLERNKVLAPLCGEPVIARTVRVFERTGWFDGGIVVVTGACDLCEMKRILADAGLHAQVVLGGADRQESVCRGLAATNPAAQYVAIHDGARPLVTAEVIARTLESAKKYGSGVAAVPLKDTVKRVPAHDPLPLIDQRRPSVLPDPRVIRRHHRVHVGGQAVFERHQLLLFAALHHVVRVQPEDERLCRVVEGGVARGGKIVVPCVIIDAACKLPGHALGAVRRARVHDDDFIDRALYAAQASREPFLFVFDDHAKRKFRHGAPFRPRSGAHRAALSHRVCRETKKHAPPFP